MPRPAYGIDRRLDLDPCYLAMGETEQQRQSRYAAFVSRGVRPSELMLIREALQRGQLTGSERFVDEIDRKLGVRVERRGQGRPAFSPCYAKSLEVGALSAADPLNISGTRRHARNHGAARRPRGLPRRRPHRVETRTRST